MVDDERGLLFVEEDELFFQLLNLLFERFLFAFEEKRRLLLVVAEQSTFALQLVAQLLLRVQLLLQGFHLVASQFDLQRRRRTRANALEVVLLLSDVEHFSPLRRDQQ